MAAICVKCQVSYKVTEIGVIIVETHLTPLRPYRLWSADVLRCPGCGAELLIPGNDPIENYSAAAAIRLAEIQKLGKAHIFHMSDSLLFCPTVEFSGAATRGQQA